MERDPSHIKNTRDFRTYVLLFADEVAATTTRSLEEYLRALWSLIEQAQDQQPTHAFFGQLLYDALINMKLFLQTQFQQKSAASRISVLFCCFSFRSVVYYKNK